MKKHLLGALVALASVAAMAAPTFSTTEQGVGFTFNQTDSNSFTLRIEHALDATGDWAPATQLNAVAFKNLGFDPTGGSGAPGDFGFSPLELNANGCSGGDSGGACFTAATPYSLTNDMLFTFDLLGGVLDMGEFDPVHLKIQFLNDAGRKQGTLLSRDLTWVPPEGDPDPRSNVPEPASLALVGLGLAAAAFTRRRKA